MPKIKVQLIQEVLESSKEENSMDSPALYRHSAPSGKGNSSVRAQVHMFESKGEKQNPVLNKANPNGDWHCGLC